MAENTPQQNPPSDDTKNIGSLVQRLRSFESDIARLKGVPLADIKPEDKKAVVKQPAPNPSAIAGKPDPYLEANGKTAESLEAANVVPPSEIIKEDPQVAVAKLHKEAPVQQFRTIQTDVADAAKDQKTTVEQIVAKAALANQKQIVIEDPKRSIYLLVISGVLIIGGILAITGWYVIKNQPKAVAPIQATVQTIIPTDGKKDLIINPDVALINQLADARKQAPGTRKEIVALSIKEGTSSNALDAQQFASLLSPSIQPWFVRAMDPANYLVGLYSGNNSWQPLFIFKLDSYDNGYAGMLKLEETMTNEFQPLLALRSTPATTGTSTAITPILPPVFKDAIIKNKDVRVLEDSSGKRYILYSFTDPTTLVITTDQATLEEVFARLTTSKFVR